MHFRRDDVSHLGPNGASNFQQHVNVFNNIIIDLVRLGLRLMMKLRQSSCGVCYQVFVTTLTYDKDTIILDVITIILLSHYQWRQSV